MKHKFRIYAILALAVSIGLILIILINTEQERSVPNISKVPNEMHDLFKGKEIKNFSPWMAVYGADGLFILYISKDSNFKNYFGKPLSSNFLGKHSTTDPKEEVFSSLLISPDGGAAKFSMVDTLRAGIAYSPPSNDVREIEEFEVEFRILNGAVDVHKTDKIVVKPHNERDLQFLNIIYEAELKELILNDGTSVLEANIEIPKLNLNFKLAINLLIE